MVFALREPHQRQGATRKQHEMKAMSRAKDEAAPTQANDRHPRRVNDVQHERNEQDEKTPQREREGGERTERRGEDGED